MNLEYIKITKENLIEATKVQMKVFNEENCSAYYHYLRNSNLNCEYDVYYLVKRNDINVGITGIYPEGDIEENNTLWLGWYGVLPEYRHQGLGEQILLDTIEMVKKISNKYPIKYFRLYTSERDNALAQPLYKSVMDVKEYYHNDNDINYDGTCVIWSKNLESNKNDVTLWNNKYIGLKDCYDEEKEGTYAMKLFSHMPYRIERVVNNEFNQNKAAEMYLELIKSHISYAEELGLDDKVSKNYTFEKALESISKEGRVCRLVYKKDKPIAMFVYEILKGSIEDECCYVHGIYVDKEYRRNGIGELIVRFLSELYSEYPIELSCYYLLDAHQFYKKMGFVPLYTKYYKK